MELVGIVVAICYDVSLDRRGLQHPLRHDTFILVHGREPPTRDQAVRADNRVDFVAFALAACGPTVARLPVLGTTADRQRLAIDHPE